MDLRGHLDLVLLGSLHRRGPAHGYALMVRLREESDGAFDLPDGTVYPALQRLEHDGLITSHWDTSAPRRRRVYEITPDGATALAVKRAQWRAFTTGMQAIIGRDVVEGLA